MTCEELSPDYELFALGLVSGSEDSEMRAHLARECPRCAGEVGKAFSLVAQLATMAPEIQPSNRLRKRVLASVNPLLVEEHARRGFGWSVLWASAALAAFVIAALLGVQASRLSQLRYSESSQFASALNLMSTPETEEITFGKGENVPPRGRVLVNPKRGVMLIASHLPALAEKKAYQMWLIPKGAKPIPSGVFRAAGNGTGFNIQIGPVPLNLATVAVTVEDENGALEPTTTPIIAANTGAL